METYFIVKKILPDNHKLAVYNCRFGKIGQTQKAPLQLLAWHNSIARSNLGTFYPKVAFDCDKTSQMTKI